MDDVTKQTRVAARLLLFFLATLYGAACSSAQPLPPLPTLAPTLDLTQPFLRAEVTAENTAPALAFEAATTEAVSSPTPQGGEMCAGRFISVLFADSPVGTRMAADEEPHLYRFNGGAGQFITLELLRVSGDFDPFLTLCGPDGTPLAVDDDSGGEQNARLANVRLLQTGEYTVRAAGSALSGAYRLTLYASDAPLLASPTAPAASPTPADLLITPTLAQAVRGTPLQAGIPVLSRINRPGDIFQHSLFAAAGEIITIGIRPLPGSSLLPRVEVFGPSGELEASGNWQDASTGGKALIPMLTISNTGAYIVIVSGDNDSTGEYTVSFGRGAAHEDVLRGLAEADEAYSVELAERGLRDVWWVDLNAGDTITVSVTAGSPVFDPLLEVVQRETETLVAIDDNGGGERDARVNSLTAPATGRYELRVTGAGAGSRGAYTLRWSRLNHAPSATPAPQRVTVFTIDDSVPDGQYAMFPFQGRSGQRLEIRITGANGFDTVAALIAPGGTIIAQDDDSGGALNPYMEVRLPVDGTYYVRINGYGLSGGTFMLLVEELILGG